MKKEIIPGLSCPHCGGAMFFSNPPRNNAVECVNSALHRKRVRITSIKQDDGSVKNHVSFCKSGPDKMYPIRYDLQITAAQREQIERKGGAEYIRRLICKRKIRKSIFILCTLATIQAIFIQMSLAWLLVKRVCGCSKVAAEHRVHWTVGSLRLK